MIVNEQQIANLARSFEFHKYGQIIIDSHCHCYDIKHVQTGYPCIMLKYKNVYVHAAKTWATWPMNGCALGVLVLHYYELFDRWPHVIEKCDENGTLEYGLLFRTLDDQTFYQMSI